MGKSQIKPHIMLFWTTHKVNCDILRLYNVANLAEKCLATPPLFFFRGLNPLKLWVAIRTTKKPHPCVRMHHLSHKRLKYVDMSKKYNQDRTIKVTKS